MNTTSPLALAAAAVVALSHPDTANAGSRGGGGGGGQRFNFQASSAPAFRAPSAPVRSFAPIQQRSFSRPAAPVMNFRQPTVVNNNYVRNNNVRRSTPSFAFGGQSITPVNNYNAVVRNNVAINNRNARVAQQWNLHNQQLNRQAVINNRYRYQYAPVTVTRDWDRGHRHSWNNHNYRWFGNSWVIADSYPYAYYPDYYSAGVEYPDTSADYDDANVPAADYDNSDTLAADVQRALADQGFYRGVIDGDVGPNTRNSIAAYQQARRLPVTGRIDTRLLNSLGLE